MVLDLNQIIDIIKTNPNKDRIKKAVEYSAKLNMHVNGVGIEDFIEQISEYENEIQRSVRNRLRESNKGLYASLLHPTQKVFSAKGGSRRYNLPERAQKEFKRKLSRVAHNLPIKKWLEKKIFNKYITDPNGVLFMEVSENETKPTFKGINTIYDYYTVGQKVEYIIFNPFQLDNDDSKYYRVVDDNLDYLIKETTSSINADSSYSIVSDQTFINHFESCPAIVVSDIFHSTENIQSSFIDETLDKASKFFFDNSIHTVHKLLHGFAKYWEYGRDCMNCGGTGIVETPQGGTEKCHVCDGTGTRPNGDVSDKLIIPFPNGDEKAITKFSGFESPDISIWQQYKEDLKDHEKDLVRMLWNTNYADDKKSETATGRFIDVQPINEKLNTISDNFEKLEKFVTDSLGCFYYEFTYQGSSINNGRRYLVENTDVIWNKLTKAIKDKMPVVFIKNIAVEYTESLYQSNDLESSIQLKLLDIEPFAFMTPQEVISLGVSEDEIKKKIYFHEWYSELSEAELLLKDKSTLKSELQEFINNKEFVKIPQKQD